MQLLFKEFMQYLKRVDSFSYIFRNLIVKNTWDVHVNKLYFDIYLIYFCMTINGSVCLKIISLCKPKSPDSQKYPRILNYLYKNICMISEEDRWTFFYKTTNAHKHVASALETNKPAVNLRMDSRWMFLPSAFWGFFLFFFFFVYMMLLHFLVKRGVSLR